MFVRRERVHHSGASNVSLHQLRRFPRQSVAESSSEAKKVPEESSALKSSRSKSLHETIQEKTARSIPTPFEHTKAFYETEGKNQFTKTLIGYPRMAHLEEKEKRKRAFLGDSEILLQKEQPRKSNAVKSIKTDRAQQPSEHPQSLDPSTEDLLKNKVDLAKVKAARTYLRKRYARRTSIERLYYEWDEEQSGSIAVENVYNVSQKFGLGLNFDEARVLIASVNKDSSGVLTVDEFLELIYGKDEKFNVELGTVAKSLGEDHFKRSQEVEKQEQILRQTSLEDLKNDKNLKHKNQVYLVLKNKFNEIVKSIINVDHDKHKWINFHSFELAMKRLGISENAFSDKDIREIFDKYKTKENRFFYKNFLDELKAFEFNYDQEYQEDLSKRLQKHNSLPVLNPDLTLKEKYNVVDCRDISYTMTDSFFNKTKKVGRTLVRYLPKKDDLKAYFAHVLKISPEDVENMQISRKQFVDVFDTMNNKFKLDTLTKRDFEGFFSSILCNKLGYTDFAQISHTLYNENYEEYVKKIHLKNKGPPPLHNVTNQEEAISQRSPRSPENPDQNFNNPKRSLKRASVSMSNIRAKSQIWQGEHMEESLKDLLNEIDAKVFRGTKNMLSSFRDFDIDKDGFLSHDDIITTLQKQHLLPESQVSKFIEYIDPTHKGFLDFLEFSRKIRPNMVYDAENGDPRIKTVIDFSKPDVEEENKNAVFTKKFFENLKKNYDPDRQGSARSRERVTRSSSRPSWTNTFLNFQPNSNSGMFLSEQGRLSVDQFSKTKYQADEKERKSSRYSRKLDILRGHENQLQERIHDKNISLELKKQGSLKIKHLIQQNYENINKIRNTFN